MLMYPRKGLITDPYNSEDIIIQDDQYPPDFYSENALHYDQSRLQSPFQCHPSVQLSPPSSAPSSPTFSSPTFSTSYPQTSDCQSFGAPSMTPAPSYNPSYDIQGSNSPSHYLPQYPQQYYTPMLVQQPLAGNQGWDSNLQLLTPARTPIRRCNKRDLRPRHPRAQPPPGWHPTTTTAVPTAPTSRCPPRCKLLSRTHSLRLPSKVSIPPPKMVTMPRPSLP